MAMDEAAAASHAAYRKVSTLYLRQTFDIVQAALKKRSIGNTTSNNHIVELTPLISKLIDEMVSITSKGI